MTSGATGCPPEEVAVETEPKGIADEAATAERAERNTTTKTNTTVTYIPVDRQSNADSTEARSAVPGWHCPSWVSFLAMRSTDEGGWKINFIQFETPAFQRYPPFYTFTTDN